MQFKIYNTSYYKSKNWLPITYIDLFFYNLIISILLLNILNSTCCISQWIFNTHSNINVITILLQKFIIFHFHHHSFNQLFFYLILYSIIFYSSIFLDSSILHIIFYHHHNKLDNKFSIDESNVECLSLLMSWCE